MDVAGTILSEVIKRLPKLLNKLCQEKVEYTALLERRLGQHLAWVAKWAAQIQFYGMSHPEQTEDSTIPLRMAAIPRRFRGHGVRSAELEEKTLLYGTANYLLIGDPGAGKTTTIKRLARTLLTCR